MDQFRGNVVISTKTDPCNVTIKETLEKNSLIKCQFKMNQWIVLPCDKVHTRTIICLIEPQYSSTKGFCKCIRNHAVRARFHHSLIQTGCYIRVSRNKERVCKEPLELIQMISILRCLIF